MDIGSCNSLSATSFRTSSDNYVNLQNVAPEESSNRIQMRTSELPKEALQTLQTQLWQQPIEKYTNVEPSETISFVNLTSDNLTSDKAKFPSSLITDAVLAEFPYTANKNLVQRYAPNWDLSSKLSSLTKNSGVDQPNLPEKFKPLNKNGIRTKSGMIAYLFENKESENKEMRLVFGGTTSGKNYGSFLKRSVTNFKTIVAQWASNAKNLFGAVPDSYNDAHELLVALRAKYPNANIVTSGHSLGGAEACFAAMKVNASDLRQQGYKSNTFSNFILSSRGNRNPQDIMLEAKENFLPNTVKSDNFSTAKLGKAAQKDIAKEIMYGHDNSNHSNYTEDDKKHILDHAFEILSQDVTHKYIKGDMVPELGGIVGAKHFGNVTVFNTNNPSRTGLPEHINFREHLMSFFPISVHYNKG